MTRYHTAEEEAAIDEAVRGQPTQDRNSERRDYNVKESVKLYEDK